MKKLTKRKMYHKRRKKEKIEQRKVTSLPTATGSTSANTNTTAYKNNMHILHKSKNYQQNSKHNNNQARYHSTRTITSYSQSLQSWWETYCSAIDFHTQQQRVSRNESNVMTEQQTALFEKYANEYETSSEEEDGEEELPHEIFGNENVSMDDEYLKFLEITHKHREELRFKRAQEDVEKIL